MKQSVTCLMISSTATAAELQGEAWERGGVKPLDGLTKAELKTELQAHDNQTQLIAEGI